MTEERIYTDQWQDDACPVGLRAAKSSRKIGGYALNSSGGRRISVGTSRLLPQVSPTSRAPTVGLVCCADISTTTRFCLAQKETSCQTPISSSGTLQCSVDATGLLYEVDCPECRNDVLEMVARRDVAYSSFAFEVQEQEWGGRRTPQVVRSQ
jgi:Caudovirus prohead serine protease